MRRKAIAKALAISLSVSMLGTSVQPAGIVYAEETVQSEGAKEDSQVTKEASEVEETVDGEHESTEAVTTEACEEKDDENTSAEKDTEEKESDEVTSEETSEEETSEETTAEEEATTEEITTEETTEEETTEEETTEELISIMGLSEDDLESHSVNLVQGEDGYDNFNTNKVIAEFDFGKDVNLKTVYDSEWGYGFSDVNFNTDPKGWVGGVYYPRVANVEQSKASYVEAVETDNDESVLAIRSKVWTETESSGYGVYTYENTSTFDMDVYNADYLVEVTFANPTQNEYTAYVEAEDITKKTDVVVKPGQKSTASFEANVVDGKLNLKFLAANSATSISTEEKTVYVDKVKVTRKATQERGSKPTIFIASDSTVQTYDKYYYPQTGWGQTLAMFFGTELNEYECNNCGYSQSQTYETENVIVENRAIGGRSSKSFIDEGKFDDLIEDVKPGDYLLVQWGHNDATASRPNRYVSSNDFEKWMMYYVNGALQRGATPVLVTPVARYSYTTNADGTLKSFASNFEAYRQVMLKIAKEKHIPIVDLTQRSIDVCNSFGIEGSKSLFLHVNAGDYPEGAYKGGATDSTHLQYYGAYKFAQCVANGIQEYNDTNALDSLKKLVVNKTAENVPDKITGLSVTSVGASSVSIKWEGNNSSELYYIYRAELKEGQKVEDVVFDKASKFSVSVSTSYTDASCAPGITYVYAIGGFNEKGVGELSEVVTAQTKTAGIRFDFNYNSSVTQEGWTGVNQNQMYSKENGYGWITAPNNGRDRGVNNADAPNMARDFNLGGGEFAVDLPNGDYEVTIYAADLLSGTSTIKPAYTAEGNAFGSISCKQSVGSCTNTVRVKDGQLNIGVGGTNAYINGMTITALLVSPSGVTATEASVNGSKYSFLLGFNTVDDAAGYKIYQKGENDKDFYVAKSFTVEEYSNDELSCKAMSVDLGDTYEFYVTCWTKEGAESSPSEVIKVVAVLEGVDKAQAPANLMCISPSVNATELQNFITLEWDKVADVEGKDGKKYPAIKYNIYRSDKKETDKGFKEFVKIGSTDTTSFTDTDVTTNVPYYYKVAAVNAGGEGELSSTLETPVSGKLVTGGREKYTDRALVAINLAGKSGAETLVSATDRDGNKLTKGIYLSWRSFGADLNSDNELQTTFTVYRNGKEIAKNIKVTNLVDEAGTASDIYTVVGSTDKSQGISSKETKCWDNQYLDLKLYCPEDQTMPDGNTCSFSANDMTVADLDGDGVLELVVKWYPSNAQDNSKSGYTGSTFLDGYDVDFATGEVKLLWRIDLGVNIRSGAHYTQFQVWDYNCDGKAEIAVKTADGSTTYVSKDGTEAGLEETGYVGACSTKDLPVDRISTKHDYRNSGGYVLDGPEYFTMFNGNDGTIIDTVDYTPARGNVGAWGDAYGNRVDRFLSATAYLDGKTPFAVFARGYYTRTCLTAYYLKEVSSDNGEKQYKIAQYWAFDSNVAGKEYEAQGNHGLSVNDVDNDGKDEIIFGAICIDHDGTAKYNTKLGHGDAMHVSDWVSWNDGLEIMKVGEHADAKYQVEILDAETGKVLIGYFTGSDTGRGVAADIDPTALGAEFWATAGPKGTGEYANEWDSADAQVYSTESSLGKLIALSDGRTPSSNFTLFWDGDLLSEVQDHKFNKGKYEPIGLNIQKWNYETDSLETLLYSEEIWTNNGTKGNAGLVADVLGDWREEVITRTSADKNVVRIYSTTIQTDYVVPCLLENLAYREGVAWQNVGYNQPANLSYLLSEGLVTAKLSEGKVAQTTANVNFTPANDGKYGHDIEAYEIYRAKEDGKYELIDTVKVADLQLAASADDEEEKEEEQEKTPVSLKFDFGEGAVQEGWTQVKADTLYSDELGYGFTDITANGNKAYKSFNDNELSAVYNDCVLGWLNGAIEFKAKVPNGKYKVTFYIGNGSGNVYNKVTAENVDFTDVRRGRNDIQATCETKEVEVTDGEMNIINNLSKSGTMAIYFSGIAIEEIVEEVEEEQPLQPEVPETERVYVYKDKNLTSNTRYSYKIAAVVDGKTSYMSRPLDIETAVAISSIETLDKVVLVEGTPVSEEGSVADLLPQTIKVTADNGDVLDYAVKWNAENVDITKVGTYKVTGTVKGYSKDIELEVEVVANEFKGFVAIPTIKTIAGKEITLPETVEIEYTNTTTKKVSVTWNTENLDINTVGEYELTGTVEGLEQTVKIKVEVAANYIVSVNAGSYEVAVNSEDVLSQLPKTVSATFADGSVKDVEITWSRAAIDAIDVSTAGAYTISGKVEGFDEEVKAQVTVTYKAVFMFDFGINASFVADGWTGVTVNPKKGKKTIAQLGAEYTAEKGYGFLDGNAVVEGRQESYSQSGLIPSKAYLDFVLPDGQTFVCDIPNGKYQVEIIGGSAYKSTVKVSVEGTDTSVSNAAGTYAIRTVEVEVADGQLTFVFPTGVTSRLDGIIIREISKAISGEEPGTEEPSTEEPSTEEPSTEEPSTEEPGTEEPSTEGPSTEEPSTEEPSTEEPSTEEPSTEEPSTEEPSTEEPSTEEPSTQNPSTQNPGADTSSESQPQSTTQNNDNATITIEDDFVPLAEQISDQGFTFVDVNLQKDSKKVLRKELLEKYFGHSISIMVHVGNGAGYTVDGMVAENSFANVELGASVINIPGFAEGFETYKFAVVKESRLAHDIAIHMHTDAALCGKTAYIFAKNLTSNTYELKMVCEVNSIGNVALYSKEITDHMILIKK